MACAGARAPARAGGISNAGIRKERRWRLERVDHDCGVQIDLDNLPDDAAGLQQMLREVVAAAIQQQAELLAENDKLRH